MLKFGEIPRKREARKGQPPFVVAPLLDIRAKVSRMELWNTLKQIQSQLEA